MRNGAIYAQTKENNMKTVMEIPVFCNKINSCALTDSSGIVTDSSDVVDEVSLRFEADTSAEFGSLSYDRFVICVKRGKHEFEIKKRYKILITEA
jgi:hypothetical protein